MTAKQSVDVAVPVRTAYNQWTQFETFPRFMSGVERVVQLDNVRNHWVVSIGGVQREFDTRITEQVPDKRIAWTTEDGEPRQSGIVTFQRRDSNHTTVTVQLDMDFPSVVEQLASRLGIVDRQVRVDMGRFKDFIEARDVATGAWRKATHEDRATTRSPARKRATNPSTKKRTTKGTSSRQHDERTRSELYADAKRQGVKGRSAMTKDQLQKALRHQGQGGS